MWCDPLVGVYFGVRWGSSSLCPPFYFSSFLSLPVHRLVSPTHTPDRYFSFSPHRHRFCSACCHSLTDGTARLFQCSFCHMCRPQCRRLCSSCGDSSPQSERGGRARVRLESGRATSLAAVIGQEVGLLGSTSSSPPARLTSQWAVSSVAFCFHLSPPHTHTLPPPPHHALPLHSQPLSLSELTSYCRSVDRGPGRLDAEPLPTSRSQSAFWGGKTFQMDLTCQRILGSQQPRKG